MFDIKIGIEPWPTTKRDKQAPYPIRLDATLFVVEIEHKHTPQKRKHTFIFCFLGIYCQKLLYINTNNIIVSFSTSF